MKVNVILSKESSSNEIKAYFIAILKLSKSDDPFPADLDEVWPLVYSRKSDATDSLRKNFIENVDFITMRQNPHGGKFTATDYKLSISCLEYFIARKVRPVFEVYRQVFHKTPYQIPQSYSEALMLAAKQAEQLEQANKQIERLQPKANFADAAFATDDKVDIGMAAKILKLGFGRNTLFQKLRQAGVFFSNRNEPKQRFVNAGYFEMKEKFIERDNHPGFVVTKTLVTQKGLAYINHLFGGNPSDGKLAKMV